MPTDAEKLKTFKADIDRLLDQLDELPAQVTEAFEKGGAEGVRRLLHVTGFDLQNGLIERVREIDPMMAEDLAKALCYGRA